ncbi:hypothetical protein LPJ61_005980 [Coemansia biformis]|uniref:Uncharacterized protein n=1 Tax=Coemansia biformis TaxID=1286918 RepID=A0A9W8CQ24_9FUNG|nr:hypothetical protein LPJ61_005980 [Coemansia biformis]
MSDFTDENREEDSVNILIATGSGWIVTPPSEYMNADTFASYLQKHGLTGWYTLSSETGPTGKTVYYAVETKLVDKYANIGFGYDNGQFYAPTNIISSLKQ